MFSKSKRKTEIGYLLHEIFLCCVVEGYTDTAYGGAARSGATALATLRKMQFQLQWF